MKLPPRTPPQRKFIEEAMEGAQRAAEISKAMLIYLGEDFSAQIPLDLSEVCRQHLPLLQAVLPRRVTLEVALDPLPLVVRANVHQIMEVLLRLAYNALEAIREEGGKLRLATSRIQAGDIPTTQVAPADWTPKAIDLACLEFSDNGRGIEDKNLGKIFDPFFSTKLVGRGLGLSVVMGIVKAWDGVVAGDSAAGRGTTFRIHLPLAEA